MARWTGTDEIDDVLAAGSAWRSRCLETDGSILSARSLWTEANLVGLNQLFAGNPIEGTEATFSEKLRVQLTGAEPNLVQLAAEVVWMVLLFPHASSMQAATKRQRVTEIWSWSGEAAPPDATFLSDAALTGAGGAGTYYQTNIPNQFGFLLEVALRWKRRPDGQRDLGTGEAAAFEFADWLDTVPGADKWPLRYALLYFCFPDFFERNVSVTHRLDMFLALRGKLTAAELPSSDEPPARQLDQALLAIRRHLARLLGTEQIDFYRAPLRAMWQVEDRDERRKLAAAKLEGVLGNYNLELNQTGSKKRRLKDTRPVDTKVGFWSNPNDATNKPLRWILQIDPTGDSITAKIPDTHGANRIAFLNSGKGVSGGVFVRIVPAIKLDDDSFEFFETWEWLLMLCFLPALEAGSAAQLLENYDPASGAISYKGKPQPYVAAGLLALNEPNSIFVADLPGGPRQITYAEATQALRTMLNVSPSVDLNAEAAHG
jgi:hypothetical protein